MLTAAPQKQDQAPSRSKKSEGFFFQPKLTINQPNDVYEQEADAMADRVMRMPANEHAFFKPTITPIQRKCAECEEKEKAQRKESSLIQRQESSPNNDTSAPTPTTVPNSTLPTPDLLRPRTEPDFLSMRQPFFNRGATQLWDPNSAFQVWQYNFDFFRRLGVPPGFSATLTNLTAPLAIDSQLRAGNPTWWEITDRELNTSTRNFTLPLLQFNPDFSPVAPSWFRSIFGGGGSGNVQRKKAANEDVNSIDASTQTEKYLEKVNGTGEPLRAADKHFFESRMGHDFSNVRLHTFSEAQQSAGNINALAYTHGNDIVFGAGQYQPHSDSCKRLLAHELTHVVQQRPQKTIAREAGNERNEYDFLHEHILM